MKYLHVLGTVPLQEIIGPSPYFSFLLLPGHVVSSLAPVQLKFEEDMDL